MFERTNRDSSRFRRGANLAFAILLLVAQSVGAAHYHKKDFRDNYTQTVQDNDALCSLCLFHFHAPANPGAPPSTVARGTFVSCLVPRMRVRLHAAAATLLFSRAPPTNAV
jgi:hypothetical protein